MALPAWINVSAQSGSEGQTSVRLTAALDHSGRVNRTATGTVTGAGGSIVRHSISQAAASESVGVESQPAAISALGQSIALNGYSNSKNLKFYITQIGGNSQTLRPLNNAITIQPNEGTEQSIMEYLTMSENPGNPGDERNSVYATSFQRDYGASARYRFVISIAVPENSMARARSWQITVLNSEGTLSCDFNLTQNASAEEVEVSPSAVRLNNKSGSTADITITANSSWTYDIEED